MKTVTILSLTILLLVFGTPILACIVPKEAMDRAEKYLKGVMPYLGLKEAIKNLLTRRKKDKP